jgi:ribonucleoside-triphosphate reductase
VVRKKFNTDQDFVLEEIEKVVACKSPVIIPVTGKNLRPDKNVSDDEIRLLAWIIAEGSKESYSKHRHCHRITIYQSKSKSPENYEEIVSILKRLGFNYTNRDSVPALGTPSQMIRMNAESSQRILDTLFGTRETVKFIPKVMKNMSRRQARLFLGTYLKADGHEGSKITTTNIEILNGLQQIAVDAEYGFTVGTRKPTIGKKLLYVLRLIDHQDTYIQRIRKVDYSGVIWCPSTENETVIARRNGKVFITGNTPFTNITLDLHPPSTLKDTSVVVGGAERPETYGEFQPEMDLINRAFAEVMMAGDAKGRVFTFPIPTYNLTADFDWDNPNLEPLWRMTGKYGIPYFSNFINSDMSPEDARSMCCRLRLDNRELLKRGGGLFGANPLTGSIGVVTLNLPRIGYLSDGEADFFARLSRQVRLAAESLTIKRKVLEQFTDKNLYPYSKFYLREIKKASGIYWKNHFSTIGIIGMNEACLNFLGRDITSAEGQQFALRVMDFLREAIAGLQQDVGTLFNLEATPGEGTSYRLAMLDKKRFPDIVGANEADVRRQGAAPYYTNSSQLPVGFTDDLFQTLRLQDELQCKYTGGTVLHIFLGEQVKDTAVVRTLVRKIAAQHRLPYFTLTPTFSICPSHGYLDGEQTRCSRCSESTEVYSRVVGYLRPVKQWNSGKQAEFGDRKSIRVAS